MNINLFHSGCLLFHSGIFSPFPPSTWLLEAYTMTLKCPGLAPEVLNPVAFDALPSSKSCPLDIPGSVV